MERFVLWLTCVTGVAVTASPDGLPTAGQDLD